MTTLEDRVRFPSWIDVCVGAGLNLPAVLADVLFRQKSKRGVDIYKTGVTFIKFPMITITDIWKIADGRVIRENGKPTKLLC